MKFLCLICAETVMEQMSPADAKQHYEDYTRFTAAIRKSGHLVAGNRLKPPHAATTVRVRQGKVSTTDGPFVETKEQLGGYYVIEAQESARGDPGGGADPGGVDRVRRGPAHRGGCADAARPRRDRPPRARDRGGRAVARRSAVRHFPSGVAPRYPCLRQRDGWRKHARRAADGISRTGIGRGGAAAGAIAHGVRPTCRQAPRAGAGRGA